MRKSKAKNADTRAAESELKEALGLDVDIRSGRGEKGELRIRYTTLDQLEDLRHQAPTPAGLSLKTSSSSDRQSRILLQRALTLAGDSDFIKRCLLDLAHGGRPMGAGIVLIAVSGVGNSLRRRGAASWLADGGLRHADCHSGAGHFV